MENMSPQRGDTAAWVFQAWASFIIATGVTGYGIACLPVDAWVRGFMAMGLLFTVGSTFSLAKTMRDLAEARRVSAVVQSAKVEEILSKRPMGISS
jgi:hypothetical protein